MKKYAVMVMAVMLIGVVASGASSGVVYGEPGWESEGRSEENAWEINSPEVLAQVRDDVNSRKFDSVRYYKLTSDIDLTGYRSWVPIGGGQTIRTDSWSSQPENKFFGHFDGNGHTVQVSIGWGDARNVGLFGWVDDGGSIKNLSVSGNVSSKPSSLKLHYVGGIASRLLNGTIENCNFDGTVTATGTALGNAESTYVGGIVGYAGGDEITITGCKVGSMFATSISSAEGEYGYEGGIVGYLYDDNSSSMVIDNYANVTLSGNCDNSGAIYGYRSGSQGTVENNTTDNSNNNGDNGGGNGGNSDGGEENVPENNEGNNGGNNDNNSNNGNGNNGNNGSNGGNNGGNTNEENDSGNNNGGNSNGNSGGNNGSNGNNSNSNSGGGGGGGCNSGFAVLAFALSALITLRKSKN